MSGGQHLISISVTNNVTTAARKFSKSKSEESGYDSDTTRKSGSPRGSVKSDCFDNCDTDSAASDKSPGESQDALATFDQSEASVGPVVANQRPEYSFDGNYNTIKPKMKKPPRKSIRDEKAMSRDQSGPMRGQYAGHVTSVDQSESSCQTEQSAQRHKNSGQGSLGGGGKNLGLADRNVTPPSSNVTPPPSSSSLGPSSLTTKSFKMLRLCKAPAEELGIIISKKRNQNKNTSGFEIAHIDPDGLIHR